MDELLWSRLVALLFWDLISPISPFESVQHAAANGTSLGSGSRPIWPVGPTFSVTSLQGFFGHAREKID